MTKKSSLNLLIVNQHGENRGDESAFKAMVRSFIRKYDCNITVIGQFRAENFSFPSDNLPDIHYINMVMPVSQAALLLWGSTLKFLRIPLLLFGNGAAIEIFNAYKNSDLVISGPGGPYFGDIYRGHEPVHWLFVLLGSLYKKPVYLYAPSAGPFNSTIFNIFRRNIYRRFRIIICRETESAEYIRSLDPSFMPVVTADSAIQEKFNSRRETGLPQQFSFNPDTKIISLSVLDYPRLNRKQRDSYEQAVLSAIHYLHKQDSYKFIFLPQLYGGYHSDVGYMETLINSLPEEIDVSLLDDSLSSDAHRQLISQSEMVIASRYHPQIFAASARTPFIAICYQHKSSAFMRDINMQDFALDIFDITDDMIIPLIDRCLKEKQSIKETLDSSMQKKEQLARQTTLLINQDFENIRCK